MDPSKLRLLEVFQPPEGGVPDQVSALARGLSERGHSLTVAGPPDASVRPELEAAGIRFVALALSPSPKPAQDLGALRSLVRLLHTGRFDIVHVHAQKAGVVGRLAALIARVPSVYTPHSFVYRTQLLRPRPSARARFWLTRGLEQLLGRVSAAIIGVADEERRAAVADRIAAPERVHAVLNGVRPDLEAEPDPQLLDFRGEGPLLGFVAHLRDQKGLPDLLEALDLLVARDEAVRMAIVGTGPMWSEVERRLAVGPSGPTTLLVPYAGPMDPYLEAMDVFVLPSLWEGLSLAVLEAMFHGLPVVATAVNGTPEAVADERTGLLVPPGDPGALADAMARLARDPELRARLGTAGREEAERRFTVERMVEETEAVLLGLEVR